MPPAPSPIRVLVIDDDEMSRELLMVLLEGEGYAVDCDESGEAALGRLGKATAAPDLVLADMQLPGISGAKLARKLRGTCGSSTRLLAISGSRPADEAVSRFDGFLLKPFTMEEVAAALRARRHPGKALTPAAAKLPGKRSAKSSKPSSADRSPSRVRTPAVTSRIASAITSGDQNASNQKMNVGVQTDSGVEWGMTGPGAFPVLNETIFAQLAGTMLASQLREMYQLCLDDARRRVAGMRKLAAEQEAGLFVREAHAIKGGAGMLGATELHRKAAELELHGLSGAGDVNSLDELSAACDRLERMLGARL